MHLKTSIALKALGGFHKKNNSIKFYYTGHKRQPLFLLDYFACLGHELSTFPANASEIWWIAFPLMQFVN